MLLIRQRASPPVENKGVKIDPYWIAERLVRIIPLPLFLVIGYFLFDGDWDAMVEFAAHNVHIVVFVATVLFTLMRTVFNNG
jgi:hypothetical protein